MQQVISLTEDEISSLKTIQETRLQLIEQFGIIEFKLQELNKQKNYLISKLDEFNTYENNVASQLQQKYGDGTINIEKGEFIKQ